MPRADRIRTIAFVTYPGMALLELVGPITTFFGLTRGLVMPSRRYRAVTVGARSAPTRTDTPMALILERTFEEVPDPFGVIVIEFDPRPPFGGSEQNGGAHVR